MNTFDLRLDLDKGAIPGQVVRIRQGDHDGTTIRAAVYDHGAALSGKDIRVAEQHYHNALADAATSGRPHHACVILDSDGNTVAQYGYANEVGE